MAVELKLVKVKIEDKEQDKLVLVKEGKQVSPSEALKEGVTITGSTFSRLQKLVELGQRYEEVAISFKSEFQDL